MNDFIFTAILLFGSMAAGLLGALTGLGGGIVIVPLLSVGLGIPMKYAVAASLISVIGTSSGSASGYVKEGITNVRIGMFLEIATTIGAILGALVVVYFNLPVAILGILFGCILMINAFLSLRKKGNHFIPLTPGSSADKLQLVGTYKDDDGITKPYAAQNVTGGFFVMMLAGLLSGLLGIGGGAFKVLAMDNLMKLPFKVSTTTSNFMIGVTAVASSLIYLLNGYIIPEIAAPVVIGVLIGSRIGGKLLMRLNTKILKIIFFTIVSVLAVYMIYNGIRNAITP